MAFNYHCFNTECRKDCQFCDSKGELQIEEESNDFVCPNDATEKLKCMGQTVTGKIGPKMTKTEIVADRRARSNRHFVTEVLPTLDKGSAEQKHFIKKHTPHQS